MTYRPRKDDDKGFTLVELLIVVAVLGILAAIAIPQYAQFRLKAYNTSAQTDLKNMRTYLELYYADEKRYP